MAHGHGFGHNSPGGLLRYPEQPPFPLKEYSAHYDHIFEMMEELEAMGEILIHRITEEHLYPLPCLPFGKVRQSCIS